MLNKKSFCKILALSAIGVTLLSGAAITESSHPAQAASTEKVLKLKSKAYEYTRNGKRAHHGYLSKGYSYYAKGTKYIHDKKYYLISDRGHRYYIRASKVRVRTLTKFIRIIHNSYLYNKYGNRLWRQGVCRPGSYFLYGTRYIDGDKYYEVGDGMYVKAGNVAAARHRKNTATKERSLDKALQPYRTVYIDFGQDDPLYQPLMQAITEWNNTGAITFTVVNDKSQADINVEETDKPKAYWAGLTTFHDEELGSSRKEILKSTFHATVYYNTSTNTDSKNEKLIFEHELGHAIGLSHNHEQSIMNDDQDANGNSVFYSVNTIQPIDITHVKELYNEK